MSTTQDPQVVVVVSDRLPVMVTSSGGDEPFLAAGFTFGEPDPQDPLFRPATLPAGWTRKPTDHVTWTALIDMYGRERVRIFFYDPSTFYSCCYRRAHMSWTTQWDYLLSLVLAGGAPVLDDEWLPAGKAIAELEQIATNFDIRAVDADRAAPWTGGRDRTYWSARAQEHRANAAKARALAAQISQQ